jgi:hypothetical protein
MSNFQQATREAPADADLIYYRAIGDSFVVIRRGKNDVTGETVFDVIANASREAVGLIIGGASSRKMSVYDFDARKFDCGTVEQLQRVWTGD